MSFPIILLIMLGTGFLGGIINYFLPANENTESGKKLKPWRECLLLGIGATLLVPLFLEIAQSKLLDKVFYSFSWQEPKDSGPKSDTVIIVKYVDSIKRISHSNISKNKNTPGDVSGEAVAAGKNYLLYAAYCLVAASAGFRFINMLISNVVKEEQINKQQTQLRNLKKAKEKRVLNSQLSQQQEDEKIRKEIVNADIKSIKEKGISSPEAVSTLRIDNLPELPPVKFPDDPQKGRFGGKAENNGRRLKARVDNPELSKFYKVTIWVESLDPLKKPLNTDVVLYIHDSFSPSVYRITPSQFRDGKAIDDTILSYGAFTVGAITDNGKTLLELDLSEDSSFPKEFRER